MSRKLQRNDSTPDLKAQWTVIDEAADRARPLMSDAEIESAERDYAFGSYEFFGQEWGERLIAEVKRLRGLTPGGSPK